MKDCIETGINASNNMDSLELASRTKRLIASIIDVIILIIIFKVGYHYSNVTGLKNIPTTNPFSFEMLRYCCIMQMIFFFINLKFLFHGQTIGKKIMHIRVVTMSNDTPSITRLFVVRYLSIGVIFSLISFINLRYLHISILDYVFFADPIFIFGHSKRCIHDYLARTKVINAIN